MDTGVPGMSSDRMDRMARLETASGASFDRNWLQMMIEHHQGAPPHGRHGAERRAEPDALALARQTEAGQTAEISKMQEMLGV
jgi:uncharacterized protein (DUF305 family)